MTASVSEKSIRLWDPPFLMILAAGIALRFIALGQQSFGYDEIDSVTSALGGPGASWRIAILNPHGTLYLVLLKGWMALFGHGEGAVRALSAILGSVGLVIFYRVALRFIGRTASLFALALLAFSPFYLWYSQIARNYVLLFDLGLLAVAAFAVEVERRTKRTFLLALLATAATCIANLSGFFLFVMFMVYALAVRRQARYPVRRLVIFLLLSAAMLWPWVIEGSGATGRLNLGRPQEGGRILAVKGEAPPGLLSVPFTFYNFSLGYSLGPSIDELKLHRLRAVTPHLWYLLPAGALFALLALRGLLRIRRSSLLLVTLWAAIPLLLMMALSSLNLKAPNTRYATLSFAPYLLLLAAGVHSISSRYLKTVLFAVALLYFGCSDYQYLTDQRYWRPDVRGAAELINREAGPDDVVVIYTMEYLRYYLSPQVSMVKPTGRVFSDETTMEQWLRRNTAHKNRVWIVQLQGWWVDRDDRFLQVCRSLMTQQRQWHFARLPVYLFSTPQGWGSQDAENPPPPTKEP
jgi:uncharacterized membrane protein